MRVSEMEDYIEQIKDYPTLEDDEKEELCMQGSELDDIFDDDDIIEIETDPELEGLTLCTAVMRSNIEKVRELAEDETQINSFCEECNYKTPLAVAVEIGNYEIVKILLDAGADPYLRIVCRCQQYHEAVTPLTLAKRRSRQEGYDKIIELLEEACRKKDLEYANEVCRNLSGNHDREFITDYIRTNIIDCGADINMRDENGNTPLLSLLHEYYIIAGGGDCRELKLLLENGANPNVCNNAGWTPLTEVICCPRQYEPETESETQCCRNCYHGFGVDCAPVVELLLEYGADLSYAMCADFAKACMAMQILQDTNGELEGVVSILRKQYGKETE